MDHSMSSHIFVKTTFLPTPTLRFLLLSATLSDVDQDSALPFKAEINVVQPHVFNYMKKCDKVVMKAVNNFFFQEREIPRHLAEHILSSCVIIRERQPVSPPSRPFPPLTQWVVCSQSGRWCLNSGWHVSVCLPPHKQERLFAWQGHLLRARFQYSSLR